MANHQPFQNNSLDLYFESFYQDKVKSTSFSSKKVYKKEDKKSLSWSKLYKNLLNSIYRWRIDIKKN